MKNRQTKFISSYNSYAEVLKICSRFRTQQTVKNLLGNDDVKYYGQNLRAIRTRYHGHLVHIK